MAEATAAQLDWVQRVLNFSGTPADPAAYARAWTAAVARWRTASDAADVQISALQKVLQASGDPELEEIAEYGLNAVTGGFKVKLMALVQDAGSTGPSARAAARARTVVAGLRGHIDGDERVLACDENPFGVQMNLRGTLGAALTQLDAALRLAPRG